MPIFDSKAPPNKNQALLVSVMEFDHGVSLPPRRGVKKDTKRLHKILSKLGFQVTIHNDLTAEEIRNVFKTACIQVKFGCQAGDSVAPLTDIEALKAYLIQGDSCIYWKPRRYEKSPDDSPCMKSGFPLIV
ncbi:hypothetical protein EOD39_19665 [Acipenser ruthenus]|uniref:Caspase family p20 domain-containing protein n=1 Tax=Acipenser ruthenus TaxID=7906 RepID=A0A444UXP0_ACIRT|nr:hypothetical protein EOD39_19665 [Acipenser ruthenus]